MKFKNLKVILCCETRKIKIFFTKSFFPNLLSLDTKKISIVLINLSIQKKTIKFQNFILKNKLITRSVQKIIQLV